MKNKEKRLIRVMRIANGKGTQKDLDVLGYIDELEDRIDDEIIPDINKKIEDIKDLIPNVFPIEEIVDAVKSAYQQPEDGKQGEKGENGRDGVDGKDGIGRDGKDGRDGIDGKDGKDGIDGVTTTITERLAPVTIKEMLESLEGDERFDYLKIKNTPNLQSISDALWQRTQVLINRGTAAVDTSNLVPYTGAISDVDLGSHTITASFFIGNGSQLTNVHAGGSNTQLQFNNSGVLDGVPSSAVDPITGYIGVGQTSPQAMLHVTPKPTDVVGAPSSLSINFVLSGSPLFTADNTSRNFTIYGYRSDISPTIYDASGVSLGQYDPNDGQGYGVDLSWSASSNATGYIVYYQNGNEYVDVGNVTSITVDGATGWTSGAPTLTPFRIDYKTAIFDGPLVDFNSVPYNFPSSNAVGVLTNDGAGNLSWAGIGSYVISVFGTTNRITSSGGVNPFIDISSNYIGQSSITTLGTITTGVWQGTAIANAKLANSTISGISLGSNLAALTATNATLTFSGSYTGATARTVGLNLANANTWTGQQTFNTSAAIFGIGTITPKIYPAADSTSAIQLLKADGTTVIGVWDTTNSRLGIGLTSGVTPSQPLDLGGPMQFTGVPVASAPTAALVLTSGNLAAGAYTYRVSFVTAVGETVPTNSSNTVTVTASGTNGQVLLTNIPVSANPYVIGRNLYRIDPTIPNGVYYKVTSGTTITNNTATTYTDSNSNASVAALNYGNITSDSSATGIFVSGTQLLHFRGNLNLFFGLGAGNIGATNLSVSNIGIGSSALYAITTGTVNTVVGSTAGITSGTLNSLFAPSSGSALTTQTENSCFGQYSYRNGTGNYGSFFGSYAGLNLGGGDFNAIFGRGTFGNSTSGGSNSAFGAGAGGAGSNGHSNWNNFALFGYNSAANLTANNLSNITVIGGNSIYALDATSSNTLNITNAIYGTTMDGTNGTISTGKIGLFTKSPNAKLEILGTTEQLRLSYDASNYFSNTISSSGSLTMALTGTSPLFTFSQGIINSTLTASKLVLTDSSKMLVSGTATNLAAAGIVAVVASTFEKAETGSDANILTYTTGAADEFLVINVATDVSAITGTSIVVTVTWKDSNNATATSTLTLTAVGDGTITVPINAKTATNVVVSTVFVGVSTAYNTSAFITRLK